MLINQAMRNTNTQSSARVLGGTVVVSEKFISSCLTLFDDAMRQKAQKVGAACRTRPEKRWVTTTTVSDFSDLSRRKSRTIRCL